MAWCVSPRAHRLVPTPDEPGVPGVVHCWPELVRDREWAEVTVSRVQIRVGYSVLDRSLLSRVGLTGEEVRCLGEVRV